ncbi:MAG: hypothetical protein M3Q70_03715 [bacterium]|nr:hypothetical protein [bacterium]
MTAKKMTDVSKPDSTPANATSKPIILGHKPMVADPMVSAESKEKADSKQPMTSSARSIQPISEEFTQKPQAKEAESEAEVKDNSDEAEIIPVKKAAPRPVDTEEEVNHDREEEITTDDQKAEIANQEENTIEGERQQRLKAIIESKKYNVHFRNPHKASAKIFVTTVLAVLVLGALAVLLLDDAGAIDLGINLPFDIIK